MIPRPRFRANQNRSGRRCRRRSAEAAYTRERIQNLYSQVLNCRFPLPDKWGLLLRKNKRTVLEIIGVIFGNIYPGRPR